jgi:hypothetical protein
VRDPTKITIKKGEIEGEGGVGEKKGGREILKNDEDDDDS